MMSTKRQDPDNRRRAVRHPANVTATICYGPKGSISVACTIRNISTGGAMIEAAEVSLLPVAFRLLDLRQSLAYDARVVWRRGNQVGVAFDRTLDLKPKAGLGARALKAVKSLVDR